MASIQKRQRADGQLVYRVRIRVSGMPLISETFGSYAHAKTWAKKKEAELLDCRHFPKDLGKERTFAELVERYIEKELPKKPKSVSQQSSQLRWWKKHLGKYFLYHITPAMIAEITEDKLLAEKTYRGRLRTSSTGNRYLAILSHAFTCAVKQWGWLKENPVGYVKRLKEGRPRDRFLEKDEITRLLAECRNAQSPHLYTIVLLLCDRGAPRRNSRTQVARYRFCPLHSHILGHQEW